MGNIAISATYSDINMELQILAGVYTLGAMWEFVLYPYGRDIVLDDYTIPFVDPDLLTITVTEVLSTLNCKPNCND